MVGVFSIHVTKSLTAWACRARPWAALFPSLHVCWTFTCCSCCIFWMVLEMILAIVMGGSVGPCIAKHTTKLSLSKITFWTPISFTKPAAASSAFASTSKTPNRTYSRLLIAATTLPCSSLAITPIPAHFCFEKDCSICIHLVPPMWQWCPFIPAWWDIPSLAYNFLGWIIFM